MKKGEANLTVPYFQLVREMRNVVRNANRNYEDRIANQTNDDPEDFFQMYNAKERGNLGPFGSNDGKPLSASE